MSFSAAPKINVPSRFQDVAIYEKGEDVVLKIPFTGHPKPTARWLRDGEEIKSGGQYDIEIGPRHAFLTIKKVRPIPHLSQTETPHQVCMFLLSAHACSQLCFRLRRRMTVRTV